MRKGLLVVAALEIIVGGGCWRRGISEWRMVLHVMDLSISMFSGEERQKKNKVSGQFNGSTGEQREQRKKILYPAQDIYIYGVVGEDVPD